MATVAGLYGFGDDSRSHGVRYMERQRTVQRDDTYDILCYVESAIVYKKFWNHWKVWKFRTFFKFSFNLTQQFNNQEFRKITLDH